MKKLRQLLIVAVVFVLGIVQSALAVEGWTFSNGGVLGIGGWTLDSYFPSTSGLGTAGPTLNQTLTIQIGKRYQITDTNFTVHPLEIIAKGTTSAGDIVLLSMKSLVTGSFEADPGVNWQDTGTNTVSFTLTQALYNAMIPDVNHIPGYRCGVHITTMRGNFNIIQPLPNPIPALIQKGTVKVELQKIAVGLTSPIDMKPAPDGSGRLFIVDQAGKIFIIQNGILKSTPFLDVTSRLVSPLGVIGTFDVNDYDERGFLGMAFHPGFTNPASPGFRKIYTFTSEPNSAPADFVTEFDPTVIDCQSVIAEWMVSALDPNQIDTSTRREIMRINKPEFNHNGGMLVFGPDGYLYISLGDGGAGNDSGQGHGPNGNGQNLNVVLGKILRIDPLNPSSTPASTDPVSLNGKYRVPAANPFVGVAGVDEIYAYGLRNPFRISFDSLTGKLIAADVGQDHVEEIDIIQSGKNYGWNLKEGTFRFDPQTGNVSNYLTGLPSTLVDPVAEYDHDDGSAIIGGYMYRGSDIPELVGKYVFGDFTTGFAVPGGRIFYADINTGLINEFVLGLDNRNLNLYLKGLGQDNLGEVYVLASRYLGPYGAGGEVLKIVDLCAARMPGDLNNDCVVDLFDLNQMSLEWLGAGPADLDGDAIVDFGDFAILAQDWRVSTARCAANMPGDLNNDCVVDLFDLNEMFFNWLGTGPADLNGDGIVDFIDFAILAQNWLVIM
jgi:glucose/arabinose dehydrogenase